MARQRRRPWRNALESLPRYERLLTGVQGLDEPVRTRELQEYAGLTSDLNGTLGALFMLEVQGRVHPTRAPRRQLIWHPGRRSGPRPETLPELLPFERVPKLLRYFGTTRVGTGPIMTDVHFVPVGSETHGRRERMLGALKILAVLGIAAWDREAGGWYEASATSSRPYVARMFGPREGEAVTVELSETLIDKLEADRG